MYCQYNKTSDKIQGSKLNLVPNFCLTGKMQHYTFNVVSLYLNDWFKMLIWQKKKTIQGTFSVVRQETKNNTKNKGEVYFWGENLRSFYCFFFSFCPTSHTAVSLPWILAICKNASDIKPFVIWCTGMTATELLDLKKLVKLELNLNSFHCWSSLQQNLHKRHTTVNCQCLMLHYADIRSAMIKSHSPQHP